ncbi:MAG TPA: thioredoxin family protein [Gaiellaceae bacterium]|nr:thioredoxin family protein [Gaiellaceae bacterium]
MSGASGEASLPAESVNEKPQLLYFYSPTSGFCRRVEGFLAQVLQQRQNHATFALRRIDCDERPELAARFAINELPTLVVVEGKRVRARLERPRGSVEIRSTLEPWLKKPPARS